MALSLDEVRSRVDVLRHQAAAERRRAAPESGAGDEDRAVHLMAARIAEMTAASLADWAASTRRGARRPRMTDAVAALIGTPSVSVPMWFGPDQWPRLSASDSVARAACEAEILTGQGPATQARSQGAVVAADWSRIAARWPLYSHAAAGLGMGGAVAAPLGPPGGSLGAICAYYADPEITAAAVTMTRHAAAAVTRLMLHQAGAIGLLLAKEPALVAVHRAVGLIRVRAACTTSDARLILASAAFAGNISLAQAAEAVLNGDITLGHQAGDQEPGREDKPG
jgi:hypothetical protein